MINIIENISFQKENFPEILDSYKFIGDSVNNSYYYLKESVFLYFLVNERCSLMSHVNECFGSDFVLDSPASAVIVSFGYENREFNFEDGIAKFSINHPYLEIGSEIVFSSIVINNLLEKTYALYTFIDKPLKQTNELQIRKYCQDYCFETHNLSTYQKLLDTIVCNSPKYKFSYNKANNVKRMFIKDGGYCDKHYSLLLISIINDSFMLKENEIIKKCVDGIMRDFSVLVKDNLKKHLQAGKFDANFIIIEKYFKFEKNFKQEMVSYLKDKLLVSIRDYKDNTNSYTTLHNLLSNDKSILGFDNYIGMKIDEINNLLEEI